MNIAKQEGLVKKFKLTSTLAITNMHLFGPDGKIRKYETPEEILEEFFTLRLEYYVKRKDALFKNITLEMRKLDEKVRFILAVVEGEIKVNNRKRAELFEELKQKGYESFPKNKKKNEPVAAGATDDDDGNEESPADGADAEDASGYDYLLSMSIGTLTREKVQQLIAQQENLSLEVERLRLTEPKSLWFKDLDALEKELDAQEKRRAAREKNRKNKEAGTKAAPKRQPKKTYVKSEKAGSDDEDYGAPMPKAAAQKKKPAKKAIAPVKEEEEEMLELKDRLAAL
ncbi:DNA topoisomerase 2 isoform X2 [Lolium perenne]|uniref:DNA topoisomerase 2 isoform X2 n=1 Tax=Lolium perenne TaxID=4522 RepID=UPI003A998826